MMTTEHGGEIPLLAPGWTSFIVVRGTVGHLPTMCRTTMRDVQPGASKRISPLCSLVIWSMVGNFSYSSQAGHLIVVWRVVASMLSHHHSERGGEILFLAPSWTSPVIVWCMVASKRLSLPCTERRREGPDCDEKENLPTML